VIDTQGKRVLLVGFGSEGRANLQYVAARNPRSVGIADQASTLALSPAESALVSHMHTGSNWLEAIGDYDILIRSPGVPLHTIAQASPPTPHYVMTSGTNIFLRAHSRKSIGITGTKGKSTTTSLIYNILKNAGINACLGGNIGIAPVSLLETPAELYVLELSSYQLEDCSYSPHGAVFLNLYPEHLDHHGNFTSYGQAKAQISRHQGQEDFLVVPHSFPIISELTTPSSAARIAFGSIESCTWIEGDRYHYRTLDGDVRTLCSVHSTRLKGPGNQQNILAALAVASRYRIPDNILVDTITNFAPLPHRLEEVGRVSGVTYINDSISTVPQATMNALETFGPQVKTLILGGYDRGIPFDSLGTYLASSAVETLLLFPPSGSRIQAVTETAYAALGKSVRILRVESMRQAIDYAREFTPPGGTCLLSPASPSFPIFKNFEERGEQFKAEVERLAGLHLVSLI
jgi:UDP-N-acetylmuramoylalanine--D-glutamate ligase